MQKWKKQKNQTQGKWYCLCLIFFVYAKFCFDSIFIIYKQVNVISEKRKKSFFSSKIICYRHNFHSICTKIDMDHGHDVAYKDSEQEVCQTKYRISKLNKIWTSQNQLISFVILFFFQILSHYCQIMGKSPSQKICISTLGCADLQ